MAEPNAGDPDRLIQCICLMGPTGAGKTALAVELYQRGGVELISVDSAQVYRRMNVGTAKPDPQQLQLTPHHLIDIREPWQTYSAAEFARDASALIVAIDQRGKTPVLVGGTMLYYRALLEGLSELPEASPEIRAELEREGRQRGWQALHLQLAQIDPLAASRIHPNDPQRIGRALEVYRLSGKPLSELQAARSGAFPGQFLKLAIAPADRAQLHTQINGRFEQMLVGGLLEEVQALMALPELNSQTPAMRAVGYRQAWLYLSGDITFEQLRDQAGAATRQLAKRQLTWLRHLSDVQWLDPTKPAWIATAFEQIARFLHNPL